MCTRYDLNAVYLYVFLTSSYLDSEYMDRLELKSSSDRTLGVGILEEENSFLVLTAAILMKTYVDPDAVGEFDAE